MVNPPEYVALSYCWGGSELSASIMLDGHIFPITENLGAALQEMASENVQLLWVDALCINQSDLFERSYQVSRMGQIFAKATKVVAWLGPAFPDSKLAMKYLRDSEQVEEERQYPYEIVEGSAAGVIFRSLEGLFAMPYWERMWIVQELAKAKAVELWCGSEHISWTNAEGDVLLKRLAARDKWIHKDEDIDALNKYKPQHRSPLQNILHFRRRERESRIGVARMLLSEALLCTWSLKATDPRDNIYALSGLTLDGPDVVPTPNYHQEPLKVFRQISNVMIEEEGQTSLILLASKRRGFSSGPSWLPQWPGMQHQKIVAGSETEAHRPKATLPVPDWIARAIGPGRETFSITNTIDGDVLHVRGVLLDIVAQDPASESPNRWQRSGRLRTCWTAVPDSVFALLQLWDS